ARFALTDLLPRCDAADERAVLYALIDLKIDTGAVVRPLLEAGRLTASSLAIESLAASTDADVGPWLCDWVVRSRRPDDESRLAALRVLRHFPSERAERVLLTAARGPLAARLAALGSLGWWEPLHRDDVLACLRSARHDRRAALRSAAEAALARLGERNAL